MATRVTKTVASFCTIRVTESASSLAWSRLRTFSGRLLLLVPELLPFLADLVGDRMGARELLRFAHQLEEVVEVLAEKEKADFAKLAGFFVALAFRENEEMVAVAGL